MVGKTLEANESTTEVTYNPTNKVTAENANKYCSEANEALKNGDMKKVQDVLTWAHENREQLTAVGWTEQRILKETTKGVENPQILTEFYMLALQTGFSAQSVLAASLAKDKSNDTSITASIAASNSQFAQALMALIDDYIKQETDKKIKEDLLEKKEVLTDLGVGTKELGEESTAFKKLVKNIDDILKDKTEIKLISALHFHANLKNPINNAFTKQAPIEDT